MTGGLQKIQDDVSDPAASRIPLILVHDAGGTVFAYYSLGSLHRKVYGISNPKFDSETTWTRGIPEMARHYCDLLLSEFPAGGDILLGGWSFGGVLALEMTWVLAQETFPSVRVKGLVLIDSPYPQDFPSSNNDAALDFLANTSNIPIRLRRKLKTATRHSIAMLQGWCACPWREQGLRPPPATMLRAIEPVSSSQIPSAGVLAHVDLFRGSMDLGWEARHEPFIYATYDIPGNHFSIFSAGHSNALTVKMQNACTFLENVSQDPTST